MGRQNYMTISVSDTIQDIFADVTMRCGMVYRSMISSVGIDEQGNPVEDSLDLGCVESSIYDTEGNLLYSVE